MAGHIRETWWAGGAHGWAHSKKLLRGRDTWRPTLENFDGAGGAPGVANLVGGGGGRIEMF